MKKVKMMAAMIAVMAVVGGALAFKAQRLSLQRICSGSGPEKENCQNLFVPCTTTTFTGPVKSYYYTTTVETGCSHIEGCPKRTYFTSCEDD